MNHVRPDCAAPSTKVVAGGRRGLRISLAWLLTAMACLAVVVSHVSTSWRLQTAQQTIARQQAELRTLRDELGVLEVSDHTKVHVLFVRQQEDKAWRWRVYLPPGRYQMKWAIDDIPRDGLPSNWEAQDIQRIGQLDSALAVDVLLRRAADGKWHWFLRHPHGELKREVPADHVLVSPTQPVAIENELHGRPLEMSDPREPLVLFRYRAVPQAVFDAARAQGNSPDGAFPGVMIWIEPAK